MSTRASIANRFKRAGIVCHAPARAVLPVRRKSASSPRSRRNGRASRIPYALLASLSLAPLAQAQTNRPSGTLAFWGSTLLPYVAPGTQLTAISVGLGHSAALTSDGSVMAWGDNAYGLKDGMRLARRDRISGTWTVEVFDASTSGSLRNSIKGRPLGTPTGIVYGGPPSNGYPISVRLAIRETPY